jgi:hypothetical protein
MVDVSQGPVVYFLIQECLIEERMRNSTRGSGSHQIAVIKRRCNNTPRSFINIRITEKGIASTHQAVVHRHEPLLVMITISSGRPILEAIDGTFTITNDTTIIILVAVAIPVRLEVTHIDGNLNIISTIIVTQGSVEIAKNIPVTIIASVGAVPTSAGQSSTTQLMVGTVIVEGGAYIQLVIICGTATTAGARAIIGNCNLFRTLIIGKRYKNRRMPS